MYVWMGHVSYRDTKPYEDSYWEEQRLDLVRDWVTGLDVGRRELRLHRGGTLAWDKLLIATGSKSNRFGWKGQDLAGVQGFYDLMDLELLRENTRGCRRAVIVGGGLIAIELAEMLHFQGIEVTFLVREGSYCDSFLPAEESEMVNRVIREHGFDLRLTAQLGEILDDGHGRVGGVLTDDGERIDCQLVGLTAGVSPNIDLLRGTAVETARGVLVDRSFRTSAPDVFAAGDCAEVRVDGGRTLVQQVWYTARAQGALAGEVVAGEQRCYEPGIWFNSAKFLDLEYQVYGRVNRGVSGERSLFWEHPDHRHAVRIVHLDGKVIGLNLMGIRYRHPVCESWIREERPVGYVLEHLAEAAFDPELFARHEEAIVESFRRQLSGETQEVGS